MTKTQLEQVRAVLADFEREQEQYRRLCDLNGHVDGQLKFNGGDPWVICKRCGLKIRDAKTNDFERLDPLFLSDDYFHGLSRGEG